MTCSLTRSLALALPLLALAGPAAAHDDPPAPLRLADAVAEARAHNPAIAAARAQARAAAARPARAAALDDPVLSWEAWNVPESLDVARADNNIVRLSQKIPFPGKRGLAGAIATRDAELAGHEADAVELDTVAATERAYADLWQARQNVLVYGREKALATRVLHIAEERYAAGSAGQADVLRAQVELTHLLNQETTGTLAIDEAAAELNALLGREADRALGVPEPLPPPRPAAPPEVLTDSALHARPELAGQAATVAREETALRLAHRSYLPDFELAVGRFFNHGQADGFGASASVTIPLAYRGKYDAGVTEAAARLASARADLRRLQDRVRREVRQAFLRTRTARLQHDLLVTTHLPQAEQSLRAVESAYQVGTVDLLALIDTVRAIEAVHLEHVQAASDFAKAWADLERAVGTPLPGEGS